MSKGIVLVTGGAGFIGSHIVDLLVKLGYQVLAFDCFDNQVHVTEPAYLNSACSYIRGDVRDRNKLSEALSEVDYVLHQAAAVGVGQSMYQVERYVDYNTRGTAMLLDLLAEGKHNVKKLVVAGSMSVYGEGAYECGNCGCAVYPALRPERQLAAKQWEPSCPDCGSWLQAVSTTEEKPQKPTSIYAQTKQHQEEMALLIGRTYGIPTVVLRYFNVYGPRQSLNNPYTGVCAIFSSRIKNGSPPLIYEDGQQLRDFVHVRDVARANLLALQTENANYAAVNIGTGSPSSIRNIACLLIELYGVADKLGPLIKDEYRIGDIRHCFADVARAKELLGYESTISLGQGLEDLIRWGEKEPSLDRFSAAEAALNERGLLRR